MSKKAGLMRVHSRSQAKPASFAPCSSKADISGP